MKLESSGPCVANWSPPNSHELRWFPPPVAMAGPRLLVISLLGGTSRTQDSGIPPRLGSRPVATVHIDRDLGRADLDPTRIPLLAVQSLTPHSHLPTLLYKRP